MKTCDIETCILVRELYGALAGAMRVLAYNGYTKEFIDEMKSLGIKDGIGVRAQQWLDEHKEVE